MQGIILLANYFEDVEALIVIDLLRRAGIKIDLVSIEADLRLITQSKINIKADLHIDQVINRLNDYQFLVIPGGAAVVKTHLDSMITKRVVDHFIKNDQYIATICAAPAILGKYHYLDGKMFTCFPSFEKYMPKGSYLADQRVVVDGKLITSKAAGTTFDFSEKLISCLTDQETAIKTMKSIYYQ